MKKLISLSLFVLTTVPWPAAAHGDKSHTMGTVTAVTATSLEIEAQDGDTVSISLDSATEYRNTDGAVTEARPQIGGRVVVDLKEAGQQLTATQVRFAPPAAEQEHADHPHGAMGTMDHHDDMDHDDGVEH